MNYTIFSTLLSLSFIIEYIYELGFSFGNWYRNGGSETIRNCFVYVAAAVILLLDTIESVYVNRKRILTTLNEWRDAAGRPFVYYSPE